MAIFTATFATKAAAPSETQKQQSQALRQGLKTARTPQDSIKILYDVYDVSERKDLPGVSREIYAIATRIGDTPTQLDICRLSTAICRKDADFDQLINAVKKLPNTRERRETEMFLEMRRLASSAKDVPEAERQKKIAALISNIESGKKKDVYARTMELYSVTEYLRNSANSDLLKKYLDKLIEIANSDQIELYAVSNMIYSEAANIYSDAGDYAKAVAADKELLKIISGLEKKYKDMGRHYRNYDISKYICYRRMIRNYPALTQQEVKDYYAKIEELVKTNSDVARDYERNPRLNAFYYMALNNYAEAIPQIKALLDKEKAIVARKQLLEMLQKAAKATGDDATRLWALSEYNLILEQQASLNAAEKYKELQILYDVKDLKEKNMSLELENRNKEIESERDIMTFVVVSFIILCIALVALIFYWAKFQTNARRMGRIVDNLSRERNRLAEVCYADYADNTLDPLAQEDAWQSRMEKTQKKGRFKVSTYMTESILNDLVYISSIGRPDRQKDVQLTSVDGVLREAATDSLDKLSADFRLDVEYPENDTPLITDRECLVYMLKRIITTADARSKRRQVKLKSHLNEFDKSVSFIFTDEGSLFPEKSEELLFSNFIETDRLLNMRNWGLFYCRLISFLLNCDLRYDRTYKEGTRFIFRVPLNFAENLK